MLRAQQAIAAFYFAYFAAMGLMLPFFPLWLQQKGFAAASIGFIVALVAAAKVMAPPIFGAWIDQRRGHAGHAVAAGAALAALAALAWPWVEAEWAMAALAFCFGVAWTAILPAVDHLAFAAHERGEGDYGRLRLWGSLGFIAASLAGGVLFAGARLFLFPYALAALLFACGWFARLLPAKASMVSASEEGARDRALRLVLLAGFVMQASHGAYYGFFSLHLASAGWSSPAIGAWWVLGVLAEVWLMARWGARIQRMPTKDVFFACFLLAALRWAGLALTTEGLWLVPLQLLHAASFAAFHLAGIAAVQRMAASAAARAQGWYSAAGFGLGGALGMAAAGMIVQQAGVAAAFAVCAALALLGAPIAAMMRR